MLTKDQEDQLDQYAQGKALPIVEGTAIYDVIMWYTLGVAPYKGGIYDQPKDVVDGLLFLKDRINHHDYWKRTLRHLE